MAGERPTNGIPSSSSVLAGTAGRSLGWDNARPTMPINSLRSNGLGRYSYAPRSEARIAVMNVFCALMMMTGRSGRSFLMRGTRSKAFSSGITTSVMTRSASPWLTQRHSVAALPVERTSYPARDSA